MDPKNGAGNPLVEKILKGDFLEKAGKNVADYALANPGANGLRQFAGGNAHALVKDIGHFFGHNFKPWEAVKFAKGINAAGKALGVFGVILSVGMQAKEDQEAEQRAQDMRKIQPSGAERFTPLQTGTCEPDGGELYCADSPDRC